MLAVSRPDPDHLTTSSLTRPPPRLVRHNPLVPTVQQVLDAIERIAPARLAFEFDRIGLQVGDRGQEVLSGVVALDATPAMIEFARTKHAGIAVCHHPIIWDPLKAVTTDSHAGRVASSLIGANIAFIASHTNWDCARGGINDELCRLLGVDDVRPFGSAADLTEFKLTTFVPKGGEEAVIEALSQVGAGVIGLYDRCAFLGEGTGTFRGGEGSAPAVGQAGRIERVPEVRLEMRVPESAVENALIALRRVHRYEEPAVDLYPLRPQRDFPAGRIGRVPKQRVREFAAHADRVLQTRTWLFANPDTEIRTVAVCGGAADGEWRDALAAGADAFVTGEVRHDRAIEAAESGLALLACGHYATENPGCGTLAKALERELPGMKWHWFQPDVGLAGRSGG